MCAVCRLLSTDRSTQNGAHTLPRARYAPNIQAMSQSSRCRLLEKGSDSLELAFGASRQGQLKPHTLVEGPDVWYASDYADPDSYSYTLTETDLQEIDAAVERVYSRGLDIKVQAPMVRCLHCVLLTWLSGLWALLPFEIIRFMLRDSGLSPLLVFDVGVSNGKATGTVQCFLGSGH